MGSRKKLLEFPPEVLREILDYDPEEGILEWKHRPLNHDLWTVRGARSFNSQFAGTRAGFERKVKNRDYVRRELKLPGGKNYLEHRIIWAWMTGEWPEKMIDHIDQNPLNNRWSNLREADNATNQQNSSRRKDNTSGVVGVSWDKKRSKWKVDTQFNNCRYFDYRECFIDAVALRLKHLRDLGFSENHGRTKQEIRDAV